MYGGINSMKAMQRKLPAAVKFLDMRVILGSNAAGCHRAEMPNTPGRRDDKSNRK
jgi:hypothetical protein